MVHYFIDSEKKIHLLHSKNIGFGETIFIKPLKDIFSIQESKIIKVINIQNHSISNITSSFLNFLISQQLSNFYLLKYK